MVLLWCMGQCRMVLSHVYGKYGGDTILWMIINFAGATEKPKLLHGVFHWIIQAYHRKMFAPKYVWITPSWYSKGWWREDYGNTSCTPDFIKKMLNSSLAVTPNGYFVSDDPSTVTFSGMVSLIKAQLQPYWSRYSVHWNVSCLGSQTLLCDCLHV